MEDNEYNKILGEKVRKLRESRGWTQQELADKTGCWKHKTSIYNVERGMYGLSQSQIKSLSDVFGVSPAYFVIAKDSSPSPSPSPDLSRYSDYYEYLPYLAKADTNILSGIRSILGMPPFLSQSIIQEAIND